MSRTRPIYVAVIDDDDALRRSFGRLLRAAGIQPITYASAEVFVADTKRPHFDCVVLDVRLGGMSGIELGKRLVAEGAKVPFIYITTHDDPETREAAEGLGCAGYFHKADTGAEILRAIGRVCGLSGLEKRIQQQG
jgi:FixJ family two-component response regulator